MPEGRLLVPVHVEFLTEQIVAYAEPWIPCGRGQTGTGCRQAGTFVPV